MCSVCCVYSGPDTTSKEALGVLSEPKPGCSVAIYDLHNTNTHLERTRDRGQLTLGGPSVTKRVTAWLSVANTIHTVPLKIDPHTDKLMCVPSLRYHVSGCLKEVHATVVQKKHDKKTTKK